MKKEIVQIDSERGIRRVTTVDERWYTREIEDPETGLPRIEFRPSITYIGRFYPKGKGYEEFLKKNGDESEMIAMLAAERGSKVHQAIEKLNKGEPVKFSDTFLNNRNGQLEELTPDEFYAVMTYARWWEQEGKDQYEILSVEATVWPEGEGSEYGGPMHWAGTLDIKVRRISDGAIGVVDIKTSKDVYTSHIIQVSALARAEGATFGVILQVGYARNKNGYKWNEVDLRFDLFLHARGIHQYETEGEKPLQRDFPLQVSLNLPVPEKPKVVRAKAKPV